MTIFTPDFLRNALPNDGEPTREWRDDVEKGLIFRVTAKGDRRWSIRYRNSAGEQRRVVIGSFPSIGLAKAREEARRIKGDVSRKVDIVGVENAKQVEAATRKQNTIGGLAESYWDACTIGTHAGGKKARPKRASTIKEDRRIFEKHVEPVFGKTPVADMRRADMQRFIDKVASKIAPGTARQCRDIVRQLLSYAVRLGLLDANPANGLSAPHATRRDRVLSDAEMKMLWETFSPVPSERTIENGVSEAMALAARLSMVVLARGGEITGMRWKEIDEKRKLWTVPAARMKGKRAHIFPLSDLAIEIIEQARTMLGGEVFVFPSQSNKQYETERQMDRAALTRAVKRIVTKAKMERATPHDFRRTGATNMTGERLGISRFNVAQVLAHSLTNDVTGMHYDMNDYLFEKRKALDAWAGLLTKIVNGDDTPSNVIPIRGVA